MRILELTRAPNVVITNEEQELLDLMSLAGTIKKNQLDPRQLMMIENLIKKNVVTRKVKNGTVSYKISSRV
jgi:hypothetical protein